MGSVGDEVSSSMLVSIIFGMPILLGIIILLLPLIFVSAVTEIPLDVCLKNMLVFVIAVFIVWVFCRYQIIENGIVGVIAGSFVHSHFAWHPVFCILIGASVVGLLFLITYLKAGLVIKTLIFSSIITFLAFGAFYSDSGLFPAPDNIWKITFCIVFFLENLYIRFCPRD